MRNKFRRSAMELLALSIGVAVGLYLILTGQMTQYGFYILAFVSALGLAIAFVVILLDRSSPSNANPQEDQS